MAAAADPAGAYLPPARLGSEVLRFSEGSSWCSVLKAAGLRDAGPTGIQVQVDLLQHQRVHRTEDLMVCEESVRNGDAFCGWVDGGGKNKEPRG